jgi:DNA repair protein RadD
MINLRDYQNDCIEGIRGSYRAGRRSPLLVSPTGSGKTVMFAFIADKTSVNLKKVLILVHRQELVDQTCKTLRAFGVEHGIIAAGRSPEKRHLVQVASVQTLVRRLDSFRPDLIVIDEAHHGTAGSWRKVLDYNPQARVLGVTATPERLDGKGLREVFDDLIRGPEVKDLIRNGHLSPPVYYAPPIAADFSQVKIARGDYDQKQLAAAMDKREIIGDAVEHYARICPGAPAVAFCTSIAHAQHVADQFNAAGFSAATIDGNMDRDKRREVVAMLGDGRLQVLTSCEIINEGFDLPIVSAAILLRPTMSLGLHLQQIGRVLRVCPGKSRAVILDHVGNLGRHGLAEDVRDWSLDGRPKKTGKKKDADDIDVRQCKQCFCCHAPMSACPECGHVYEVKERTIEVVDGTLQMVAGIIDEQNRRCQCGQVHSRWDDKCPTCKRHTDPVKQRKSEQSRAQTMDELIVIGRKRGMKNPYGWAKHVFEARKAKLQIA